MYVVKSIVCIKLFWFEQYYILIVCHRGATLFSIFLNYGGVRTISTQFENTIEFCDAMRKLSVHIVM